MKKMIVTALCALTTGCAQLQPQTTFNRTGLDQDNRPYEETTTVAGAKSLAIIKEQELDAQIAKNLASDSLWQSEKRAFELRLQLEQEKNKASMSPEIFRELTEAERQQWLTGNQAIAVMKEARALVTPFAPQADQNLVTSPLAQWAIRHSDNERIEDVSRHDVWKAGFNMIGGIGKIGLGVYGASKIADTIAKSAGNHQTLTGNVINGGSSSATVPPTGAGQFPCQEGVDCVAGSSSSADSISHTNGDVAIINGQNAQNMPNAGSVDLDITGDQGVTAPTTGDVNNGDGSTGTTSPAATITPNNSSTTSLAKQPTETDIRFGELLQ